MYILVLVLEQVEKLPEILKGLIQIGLNGTTVLESTGMGRLLTEWNVELPLKNHISNVVKDKSNTNKTVFSVVENEQILTDAISTIKNITGDLNKHGRGILFAWQLTYAEGIKKHDPPFKTESETEELPL